MAFTNTSLSKRPKRDVAAIADAYRRHGSVWKAGAELGLTGQLVHYVLRKAGIQSNKKWVSDNERARVKEYYETTPPEVFDLEEFAKSIGRSVVTVGKIGAELGLTNPKRPHSDKVRAEMKERLQHLWSSRPHPRGMLGKKHTEEARAAMSGKSKKTWATWKTFGTGLMSEEARRRRSEAVSRSIASRPASKIFTRAKGGVRDDIGPTYFRSSWEANYARYLNLLKRLGVVDDWKYEPQTFWFDGVRRGTNSYKPDFRILYRGDPKPEYVELKGWVQAKDRTKWRRMAKYHPEVKLIIIGAKEYNKLKAKWASSIPEWEISRGGGLKTGPHVRTHCTHGHPMEGDNLMIAWNGAHVCRQCVGDSQRRYQERKKALKALK